MPWVYAHGELETRMGWDCLNGAISKPGVWPCVFRDDEGEASCIAFLWEDGSNPANRIVGMVLLSDDADGIRHAMERMTDACGV